MEKVIERVQKLLALAGNNPNENEAMAALEKAHAILAEHNLTMAEVRAASDAPREDEERGHIRVATKLPERYFAWVWNAVCRANYCRVVYTRPNPNRYDTTYTLVGRKINVIVATNMALYLCTAMRRLARDAAREAGRTDSRFRTAFLTGMAERLCERLAELSRREQASSGALVLWTGDEQRLNDAYLSAQGVETRRSKVVDTVLDAEGLRSGNEAGGRVSLSPQVGGATSPAPAIT